MKKFIILSLLAIDCSIAAEVRKLTGNKESFQAFEAKLVLLCETSSMTKIGPDLEKILKEKKYRKLIAKYESFGFDRWFCFDNKEDADALQVGCYNGGAITVKWYYADPDLVVEIAAKL